MSSKGNNSWVLVGKDGRTHDLSHGMIFIGREECDIVLQVVCNSINKSYFIFIAFCVVNIFFYFNGYFSCVRTI